MHELHVIKWLLCSKDKEHDIYNKQEKPLEISEQQSCFFRLEIFGLSEPELLIGDYSIKLNLIKITENTYYYETNKIKCFQNFIGLTHAELYFKSAGSEIVSSPINVFARKATYDRALSFLRLIDEKSDISSICFSVTHMSSDAKKSAQNLSAMLKTGITALEYFQENRPRFAQFPCSKTTIKNKIEQYNKATHLDDSSIAYLCSHPDSLSITYANEADVLIKGRNYRIGQIQSAEHFKNTDVFENQVILSFVNFFLNYLKNVRDKLNSQRTSQTDIISFDGQNYLSIDRLLYDSGLILNFHKEKIDQAIENCIRCISFINKHIPCNTISGKNLIPVPTQHVLARTHYLQLFSLIKNFYDIGAPLWRGQLEFHGLRNLSKIYEFVCLVNIIESLEFNGFSINSAQYVDRDGEKLDIRPINEPCNYYAFSRDDVMLELLYEPFALQENKVNSDTKLGAIVDVTHSSRKTWNPDFVLLQNFNGLTLTHVMDAKYSNYKTVLDYHIEPCVMKYTTKMMKLNGINSLSKIDSMHLLFSGDHYKYKSFYIDNLSLYDNVGKLNKKALHPIIGVISHNENNSKNLRGFLKDILAIETLIVNETIS